MNSNSNKNSWYNDNLKIKNEVKNGVKQKQYWFSNFHTNPPKHQITSWWTIHSWIFYGRGYWHPNWMPNTGYWHPYWVPNTIYWHPGSSWLGLTPSVCPNWIIRMCVPQFDNTCRLLACPPLPLSQQLWYTANQFAAYSQIPCSYSQLCRYKE